MGILREISIPTDLLGSSDHFESLLSESSLSLMVEDDYVSLLGHNDALPEVIAIQRLVTLAKANILHRVVWGQHIATEALLAPPLFPLLAVLLCLDIAKHFCARKGGEEIPIDIQSSRKKIYQFQPMTDMFADSQIVICADSRGYGRPKVLYNSDGTLVSRSDFDAFVERLLAAQIGINAGSAQAVKFSQSVSTIVAELFENTEIHGKHDLSGIPFRLNGLRGMIFKRVNITTKGTPKGASPGIANMEVQISQKPVMLEISIFDSGVGYYGSYKRERLSQDVTLTNEWAVVHRCLERHYSPDPTQIPLPDSRQKHTGMGLYEVLRALQFLKGKFEVRSGRTYGFRTFLEGQSQYQIEASTSSTRPGMPKPVLLDQSLQFVSKPTANEMLDGSSIRVLIPLA